MFLPIPSALMPDGTAPFYMNDAMDIDFHLGSQGYYDGVLRGTVTAVDAGDMFSGGVRYTQAGILRLYDATAGLPAGSVTLGGYAVSATGQLCVTTDAITGASVFIEGVAVQQDGTVHFVDVSPVAKFRKGIDIETETGVSVWGDVSGNDNDLLQATGANQPALQANGSILFDGVDDFLKCSAFTLNQPATVYFLGRSLVNFNSLYLWDGEGQNNCGCRFGGTANPVELKINSGADVTSVDTITEGTYVVVCAAYNVASSSVRIGQGAATTGDVGANNMSGFTLGARGDGTTFSNIQVKEVILFSGAHATARQNWEINRLLAIT